MLERLKVGLIVKPQGIKGEVKVQPLTDNVERYRNLKKVFIDNVEYKVLSAKIAGGFCIVQVSGVSSRDSAELLRGKYLEVSREDADNLEEGRYFIADIIGCKVAFNDGRELGEVIEVTSAKTDIFTVKTISNKVVRFPFLLDLVLEVDVEKKSIVLEAKRYLEVCCYED